jgi:CRP/FNR family transcriptional regulator, anaerobic regulatory protein
MDTLAMPGLRYSHVRCCSCPIRERAVCSQCSAEEITRLDAIKTYRDYDAGRTILNAGEQAPVVGSIVRGVVKLVKMLPDGRSQMVGLLFAGDFVGDPSRRAVEFEAIAATPVTLCLFQREPFARLLRETPNLEQRLLDMTLGELDAAREMLLTLGRKSAREKVASFLLSLAGRAPMKDGGADVALPLTRAEIAEYLGLTIETVSRQMTKLRMEGVIAFEDPRAIRVPSLELLGHAAGG